MFFLDILIIIFLAVGFLIGFRRGFTREIVSLVGIILITILSFALKNPISVFMYKNLPFFKFNYLIKGATVINILLYEIIAFLIVFFLLFIVLKILIKITNVFEKILKATIVLSIPSKILGGCVGILKHYVILFIILYVVSLPIFSINIGKSNIGNFMVNNSLGLSSVTSDTVKVFNEISNLIDEYKEKDNKKEFNQEALDLLIKYKAITRDNAKSLVDNGKIKGVIVK